MQKTGRCMTTHGLSTTAEHFGMQVARELKNPEVIEGLKKLGLASKRRTASTAVMIKGRDESVFADPPSRQSTEIAG